MFSFSTKPGRPQTRQNLIGPKPTQNRSLLVYFDLILSRVKTHGRVHNNT